MERRLSINEYQSIANGADNLLCRGNTSAHIESVRRWKSAKRSRSIMNHPTSVWQTSDYELGSKGTKMPITVYQDRSSSTDRMPPSRLMNLAGRIIGDPVRLSTRWYECQLRWA